MDVIKTSYYVVTVANTPHSMRNVDGVHGPGASKNPAVSNIPMNKLYSFTTFQIFLTAYGVGICVNMK